MHVETHVRQHMTTAATSASISCEQLMLNHANSLLNTMDSNQFVKKTFVGTTELQTNPQ